jgi:hypothetical protein
MSDECPLQSAAPALLAIAARESTWQQALRLLALAATDVNVEAFRVRASELGLDVSHLRWRRKWADISTEELLHAVGGSRDYLTIVERLGYRPGGTTHRRLESLCAERGVELPAIRPRFRITFYGGVTDDQIRAAFLESRSIADLLRRVGLVPKGDNYRVMRRKALGCGSAVSKTSAGGATSQRGPLLRARPGPQTHGGRADDVGVRPLSPDGMARRAHSP